VRRGGRLIYAESVNLDGEIAGKLAEPAVTGGAVAIATILMSPGDEAFVAALRACGDRLRGEVGASTWNGITAARFCAPDGEALRNDLTIALTLALSGAPPRLWVN
jgi:urease accessory protein